MPLYPLSRVSRGVVLLLAIGCILAAASPPTALAQTTTSIVPERDATLYEGTVEAASGSGPFIYSGFTATNLRRRGLLAFNVAAVMPAGSTILDAELVVEVDRAQLGRTVRFDLHRATAPWGEGASSAPSPGGQGTTPEPGDATWTYSFFDTTSWASPGGDFDGAISGSSDLFGIGTFTFTGSGIATDVQQWLDNPASNHGWVVLGDENVPQNAIRFLSRESGTAPALMVTFDPPPGTAPIPTLSSVTLALLALLLALCGCRRVLRQRGSTA